MYESIFQSVVCGSKVRHWTEVQKYIGNLTQLLLDERRNVRQFESLNCSTYLVGRPNNKLQQNRKYVAEFFILTSFNHTATKIDD